MNFFEPHFFLSGACQLFQGLEERLFETVYGPRKAHKQLPYNVLQGLLWVVDSTG